MTRDEAATILWDAMWVLFDMGEKIDGCEYDDAKRIIETASVAELKWFAKDLRRRTYGCAGILPPVTLRARLFLIEVTLDVVRTLEGAP